MQVATPPRTAQKIHSFTDLYAWKEGHKLVIMIYKATRKFPREEVFGLTNQLRRAVISITSNIAEGFSRRSPREKIQFYYQALDSLTEVQNQLLASKDIEMLAPDVFTPMADQTISVSKLLNGLIKKVKEDIA